MPLPALVAGRVVRAEPAELEQVPREPALAPRAISSLRVRLARPTPLSARPQPPSGGVLAGIPPQRTEALDRPGVVVRHAGRRQTVEGARVGDRQEIRERRVGLDRRAVEGPLPGRERAELVVGGIADARGLDERVVVVDVDEARPAR